MQQEDDLRGLAKVMDFMRALSILFVVVNIYWFCYEAIRDWGITIGVVDKILLNFDRTAGLFGSILWTKIFAVVFLALSCLGTKGVKEEKITWGRIRAALSVGFVLFFFNWWMLHLPLPSVANASFYILTLAAGYIEPRNSQKEASDENKTDLTVHKRIKGADVPEKAYKEWNEAVKDPEKRASVNFHYIKGMKAWRTISCKLRLLG